MKDFENNLINSLDSLKNIMLDLSNENKILKTDLSNANVQIEAMKAEIEAIKESIVLSKDMINKDGRPALSEDLKEQIKELRQQGLSMRKVGEQLGIAHSTVSKYEKAIKAENEAIEKKT